MCQLNDKVICPYCGGEMGLQTDAVAWWYECPECCARSPLAAGNMSALDAAMDLFKPLQKPLMLEEVKEQIAVWVETIDMRIESALCVCSDFNTFCFDAGFSQQYRIPKRDYNEMWRCWATKPTDEERASAKWEE